jgi:uracil-DNA glycosylase
LDNQKPMTSSGKALIEYLHDPTWKNLLKSEFDKTYMRELEQKLNEDYQNKTIYPTTENIFSAFNLTPFEKVKVVIIGQDPYHGPNQAHGACFSVQPGIKIPPSLANIYKEIESDLGVKMPAHGHLKSWAEQGVLLLNALLTVEDGKPMSHKNYGWEKFTDHVIDLINEKKENVVFMLWGSPAHNKAKNVDSKKHYVLKSVHPSPLSSYRGYFGCKHFSLCNQFLISKKIGPIDWKIN